MLKFLINMFILVLLVIFSVASAEPSSVYCCREDQGKLLDDMGVCVKNNVTTPIILGCKSSAQLTGYDFNITDDGHMFLMIGASEFRIENNT